MDKITSFTIDHLKLLPWRLCVPQGPRRAIR